MCANFASLFKWAYFMHDAWGSPETPPSSFQLSVCAALPRVANTPLPERDPAAPRRDPTNAANWLPPAWGLNPKTANLCLFFFFGNFVSLSYYALVA